MIDLGVTENFMFKKFAKNHRIPGLLKEKPYQLTVINETSLNQDKKMIKKETPPLRTQINGKYLGQIVFDLISILYKAILKITWLEKTNPSINWYTQRITFVRKNSRKPTTQHKEVHTVEICEILQKQTRRI